MLSTLVNAQSLCSSSAKSVVGEHTLNSYGHSSVRLLSHQLVILDLLETADPAGVPSVVLLLLKLLACENSLVAVDDDNVIAAVSVGSKGRLMLTSEDVSSLSSNSTEGLDPQRREYTMCE